MQKCKINKLSCCGYNKETKECNSIENCKEQIECMEKEEVINIIRDIQRECNNFLTCNKCGFYNKKKERCVLKFMYTPIEIELEDLLGDDE